MAEYLPIYKPGQALTLKASAGITGGALVAVSGAGTVATAGAASAAWLGVAAFDASTNDNVTIHCGGVQSLTASGSIAAGDPGGLRWRGSDGCDQRHQGPRQARPLRRALHPSSIRN
jgi:hypothetical protein